MPGAFSGIETYHTIANYENFWSWVQLGLLPVVYADDRLIAGSNRVFGAIRLRQLRVTADSCDTSDAYGLETIVPCYAGTYSSSTKDTAAFGPAGRYTFNTSGISMAESRYNEFGTEGYITDLSISGHNLSSARAAVQQLIDDKWLSTPTRAVVTTALICLLLTWPTLRIYAHSLNVLHTVS